MFIFNQKYQQERIEEELQLNTLASYYEVDSVNKELFNLRAEYLKEKPPQAARVEPDEMVGYECVQSYILNLSTATSLKELDNSKGETLPEAVIGELDDLWTSPKWAKAGDVVFFMHAKNARSKLTALRTELNLMENIPQPDYARLSSYIDHALSIHSKFGGKIIAIGRVCGAPEYIQQDSYLSGILHWKSRNYSMIDNIHVLQSPIDISEFRNYITLSRGGAVTPLFDDDFDKLRKDLTRENQLPEYVINAVARPIPLRKINAVNWIEVANAYRRCFILESQFRKFYVDYFVRTIGDRKRYYVECRCQRSDINDSFMDYVMLFDGKYLPVEVKLSVAAEPNIKRQVSKYVDNSQVFLTEEGNKTVSGSEFHHGKVLIIDTDHLYMFDMASGKIDKIYNLDMIRSQFDLEKVKRVIKSHLH